MANNQYGPPAASSLTNFSRQPQHEQSLHDNYGPDNHDDIQPIPPPHTQWQSSVTPDYSSYDTPYRDNQTDSPELHPGVMPSTFNGPNYDSASSRSQGSYNQSSVNNGHGQFGPPASIRTNDAQSIGGHSSQEGYGAQGASHAYKHSITSRNSVNQGPPSSYGPYQHPLQNTSMHASYTSADKLTLGAAPLPMSQGPRNNGYPSNYGYTSSNSSYISPATQYRNPYDSHSISRNDLNGLDYIDPHGVVDDGDDGLHYHGPKRASMISLTRHNRRSNTVLPAAIVGGLATGAGSGTVGGFSSNNTSGGDLDKGAYTAMARAADAEKIPEQFAIDREREAKRRQYKKLIFLFLGVLIIGALVGGVVAGVLSNKKSDDARNGVSSGTADDGQLLDRNSASVKKLMNNKNLHKVFTGMAYTPMNTQYPSCINNPPSQNNVTMDLTIMSQLTNVVRLYGTDCNQTEMVLTAIDKLQLTDMKIWVGVWLDTNATTNARQITQLWDIVDKYGTKNMKGIIVGNEVLFRKDMTADQLKSNIQSVRANMTSRNINLPVASADLGDNWTTDLASAVDVVMANVHPFFGGVQVEQAAGWTWDFWQSHDVALTTGMTNKQQIISEVGWPSQGGKDCGGSSVCTSSTPGAVAGIGQMNTFMNSWVCQALNNNTQYFW